MHLYRVLLHFSSATSSPPTKKANMQLRRTQITHARTHAHTRRQVLVTSLRQTHRHSQRSLIPRLSPSKRITPVQLTGSLVCLSIKKITTGVGYTRAVRLTWKTARTVRLIPLVAATSSVHSLLPRCLNGFASTADYA